MCDKACIILPFSWMVLGWQFLLVFFLSYLIMILMKERLWSWCKMRKNYKYVQGKAECFERVKWQIVLL